MKPADDSLEGSQSSGERAPEPLSNSFDKHQEPDPPEPATVRRRSGRLKRILAPFFRYPKAIVEGILTLGSIVLGLIFLPPLGMTTLPSQGALARISLTTSANDPTYLGLLYQSAAIPMFLPGLLAPSDMKGTTETVLIGINAPKKRSVSWTLDIYCASRDHLVDVKTQLGGVVVPSQSAKVQIAGDIKPSSQSYSEFRLGWNNRYQTQGDRATDVAEVQFRIAGPVHPQDISGPRLAVALPEIDIAWAPPGGQLVNPLSASARAEVFYDAGSYELQGSGPSVTGSPGDMRWDWFSEDGFLASASATGLNVGQEQNDQDDIFLAGVFFGVAAAAFAAFVLELVGAIQDHIQKKRLAVADS